MKKIILTGLFLLASSNLLLAYEVNWVSKPGQIAPGEPLHLVFNVGNTGNDYDSVSGQVMHLVVVDQSLDTFADYFPVLGQDGNFAQDINFPDEGRYLLFFYFKPKLELPVVLQASLDIGEVTDKFATVSMFFDTEQFTDDMMKVAFSIVPKEIKEKTDARITFTFIDGESGKPVKDLQGYLKGAGELVAINSGGKIYNQAPSAETLPDNVEPKKLNKIFFGPQVNFTMNFPGKGIYKLWGEFKHKNKIITVPFMVWVK